MEKETVIFYSTPTGPNTFYDIWMNNINNQPQWRAITMPKLDYKYYGTVVNEREEVVPIDQWIVFLAKDDAVPATLEFYLAKCTAIGCDDTHLTGIRNLINRVKIWRDANMAICKVPDSNKEVLK